MRAMTAMIGTLGALTLLGCTERDDILPGERLGVREVLQDAVPETGPEANRAVPVTLASQSNNASWSQSAVSPHVRTAHAALSGSLSPLWAVSIGDGDSRRNKLNVNPVVADGRIYTVDSAHMVRATATNGEALWAYDLTPTRDESRQAQGGGLAFAEGRLYVASGFGTLTALDPASGAEIWVQRLGATATGAPSVRDGLVYVVSGDKTGWAIEADSGRIRWQSEGNSDVNNVAGGPAPAINDDLVLFSFGSGTVQAAFRKGGLRLWSADVLGRRSGSTISTIDDITGDPMIVGDTVYVGNHSGRLVAFGVQSGDRLWTAQHGALGPVWAAGGSVFFVSDRNELVRLDAATGEQIWLVDLPGYLPRRNPQRRRDRSFSNHGPILAGGRLIVASSDGFLRSFNPADGALIEQIEIDDGATTRPVVAGGTLYVVSRKGVLHAYR